MPARHNTKISDDHRAKIKTTQIINRLQNHVEVKPGDADFNNKFMDKSQVAAALGLLKKTVPDLAQTTIQALDEKGNKSNGFKITVEHVKPS